MSCFIFENKKIFYEEKSEGIPLLFLHGNTGSSNMFAGFADRYSNDFKVVLIDFLGHGKMHLFDQGDHPAMISNFDEFYDLSIEFLNIALCECR